MALYYITGIAGSGKSSVRDELLKRDYEALDTDSDGIASWHHQQSGDIGLNDVRAEDRTLQFRKEHDWKLSISKVQELAERAKDKPIFLCGVAANDLEVWDLFSKVFALMVDEPTLKHRIITRTNSDFGKNPHELEGILGWQKTVKEDYIGYGAVIIDATRPIDQVVDDILIQTQQ